MCLTAYQLQGNGAACGDGEMQMHICQASCLPSRLVCPCHASQLMVPHRAIMGTGCNIMQDASDADRMQCTAGAHDLQARD